LSALNARFCSLVLLCLSFVFSSFFLLIFALVLLCLVFLCLVLLSLVLHASALFLLNFLLSFSLSFSFSFSSLLFLFPFGGLSGFSAYKTL